MSKQQEPFSKLALLFALAVLPFSSSGVYAGEAYAEPMPNLSSPPALGTPPVAVTPAAAKMPAVPSPVPAGPAAVTPAALGSGVVAAAVPPVPGAPDASKGQEMRKSVSTQEDKVTESAKNMVKRLDTSTDAMTLADMNSARQTITRIDAMIDLEKRLGELEKLRKDHTVGTLPTAGMLANAIPNGAINASQLQPPPRSTLASSEAKIDKHPVVETHPEIVRIFGTDGKYTAVIKFPNGEVKAARVGDQVASDFLVRSITSSSVGVDGKGEFYTLHIKNVDAFYSAMR
jgi:type IV pilus biogenesis protein PilP